MVIKFIHVVPLVLNNNSCQEVFSKTKLKYAAKMILNTLISFEVDSLK